LTVPFDVSTLPYRQAKREYFGPNPGLHWADDVRQQHICAVVLRQTFDTSLFALASHDVRIACSRYLFACVWLQSWMKWPPPYPVTANYSTVISSFAQLYVEETAKVDVNAILLCGYQGVTVTGSIETYGCNSPTSQSQGGGQAFSGGDGSGAGHGGVGGNAADGTTGGDSFGSRSHPFSSGSMGGATVGGYGGGFLQIETAMDLTVAGVNGFLSADGADGGFTTAQVGGGGSGGSVLLIANTISGDGYISCAGGNAGFYPPSTWLWFEVVGAI
jgi:hypothetical protein